MYGPTIVIQNFSKFVELRFGGFFHALSKMLLSLRRPSLVFSILALRRKRISRDSEKSVGIMAYSAVQPYI